MEPTDPGRASWQVHAYHQSLRETSRGSRETNVVEDTFYGTDGRENKQQRPATPDSEDLSVISAETRAEVLGSTELYENGKLRFIPVSCQPDKNLYCQRYLVILTFKRCPRQTPRVSLPLYAEREPHAANF